MAHPLEPNQVSDERSVPKEERSLGELFSELTRETTTLVRQEVQLAKTEMTQKATQVGRDIGFLVVGGAILYAGFLALIATVIIALAQLGLTWWLAALIVAVVVLAIGAGLVYSGMNNMKRQDLAPRETLTTLKEDAQWAKDQTK